MRKLFKTLALTATMMFSVSVLAFAEPITTAQQLQVKLTELGVPNTYIGNVVEHLQKVQITEAQSSNLLSLVDKAAAVVGDSKDLSKLTASDKESVMNLAKEAGSTIGLNVSFGKDAKGLTTVTLTDTTGKTVLALNSSDVKDIIKNVDTNKVKDTLKEVVNFSNSTETGKFQPVSGSLNNTGTNAGAVVLSGATLMALGGLVFLKTKKSFA